MAKYKYIPMPNARISSENCKIVGKEFKRLVRSKGCLKPDIVLSEAKEEKSPLHPFFTWDDSEAAEKYRLEEARTLIRSVRVIQSDIPAQEQGIVRAFVSVHASEEETAFEGNAYIPIQTACSNENYKKQVLDVAMSELREWKRRYADYQQFFGAVFSAIEQLEEVEA